VKVDIVGQEIRIGDYVAYTSGTLGIEFAKVSHYTPKRIGLHDRTAVPAPQVLVLDPSMPKYISIVDELERRIEWHTRQKA